jgi:EAL domain-containing protein (putative c-di-GMP-specific phosphodiesterase class I)
VRLPISRLMATPDERELPGLGALMGALAQEELFLLYQPMFDLRSGRIRGAEALLRWRHPSRGVVSPDRFIPFAEETGLIVPIGRWVLRAACVQGAAWRDGGHPVEVSVNLSARQFDDSQLLADVADALSESDTEPGALTLEIAERTLMRDVAFASRRLGDLRAMGVRTAIDDVGASDCSLSYLSRLPIDALKIGRALISGNAGHESHLVVRMIVRLGRSLGIQIYAEAIEDREQLAWLRGERCDAGQGYLFARPLAAGELAAMLAAERQADGLDAAWRDRCLIRR